MDNKTKKQPDTKEDGLLDKAKNLFDKADDMLDESVEKMKNSKAFAKANEALNKAENYIENKMNDFEKSGMKAKLGSMADKEGALKKLLIQGKNLAGKAESKLDQMAANLKSKPKEEKPPKKS
jgi:hypothetical protein